MNHSKLFNLIILIFAFGLFSCGRKIHLVKGYDTYHQSPFGAYMELKVQGVQQKLTVKGELIFADKKKIIIRTLKTPNEIQPYALKDVLSYKLYYAKNDKESYGTWAAINNLLSLSHGFFFLITFPVNAIVGGAVNTSVSSEFRYSEKELEIDQLYKFARYPADLPSGITLTNLQDILK
ncbi:MAG: hypothetical protein IPO92_05685 [Saprospiraceae bacterium]|nr:hypothetical protein [Saprospiraceae bacterium]